MTVKYNRKLKEVGDNTPTSKAYLIGFSDASTMAIHLLKTFVNIDKQGKDKL